MPGWIINPLTPARIEAWKYWSWHYVIRSLSVAKQRWKAPTWCSWFSLFLQEHDKMCTDTLASFTLDLLFISHCRNGVMGVVLPRTLSQPLPEQPRPWERSSQLWMGKVEQTSRQELAILLEHNASYEKKWNNSITQVNYFRVWGWFFLTLLPLFVITLCDRLIIKLHVIL